MSRRPLALPLFPSFTATTPWPVSAYGVELDPAKVILDEIHPSLPTSHDQNAYTLGRIGGHKIVVAAMPQIGNNAAATVATQLLHDFPSIRFGLLVAIGGVLG
jgi:hypothetical protein